MKNNSHEDTPPPEQNNAGDNAESPAEKPSVTIPADEFEKLEQELAEYRDKYLRLLADMDNSRKRMQKERQELLQYAVENVIVDFLNPIDQFENALLFTQQSSDEVKHWAVGFQMILKHFKDVLQNNGIVPFSSKGLPFDPHHHEAIEMIPTKEHPHGTIIEESLRGYKMGDRTIRPARVKVAKTPDEKEEKTKE